MKGAELKIKACSVIQKKKKKKKRKGKERKEKKRTTKKFRLVSLSAQITQEFGHIRHTQKKYGRLLKRWCQPFNVFWDVKKKKQQQQKQQQQRTNKETSQIKQQIRHDSNLEVNNTDFSDKWKIKININEWINEITIG